MIKKLERCRSCGAKVFWARTTQGALMPVDFEENQGGNIVINDDGKIVVLRKDLFEDIKDVPRYNSHFATCPNAYQHRRKKK